MKQRQETTIPDIVVSRLPIYLRELTFMAQEGIAVTSSQELARRLRSGSAQIRKDLSYFGGFGKQGTGYQVEFLCQKLREILHLTRVWEIALVGAGDLGRALIHYGEFIEHGFRISLVFDNNPQKIGQRLGELTIMSTEVMKDEVRRQGIKIGILAVPASAAQKVAEELVEAGVGAILNYAPVTLSLPAGVRVQYVDPVIHLQRMTFYLK